jgi:nucleotide-binding universal stress UspA family protein
LLACRHEADYASAVRQISMERIVYKKVLVPVDGSNASQRGLDEAIKVTKASGGVLRLVHVVNEFIMDTAYAPVPMNDRLLTMMKETGERVLEAAQQRVRAAGVDCQSQLIEVIGGRASDLILEEARTWQADLIVMGTHGRRGIRRLVVGSDAEIVLRSTPVPVLLVRAES